MNEKQSLSNNPEHAWFTGQFDVAFGDDAPRQYRLYVYPGKNSLYPADIRSSGDDDEAENVFEGRVTFSGDTLIFQERANVSKPDHPEWICTLSATRARDGLYIGGPETETGLFEPELAVKIAQMSPKAESSPEGRAMAAQMRTLLKRATPVSIDVHQNDTGLATIH
jgi:hypothetical protein